MLDTCERRVSSNAQPGNTTCARLLSRRRMITPRHPATKKLMTPAATAADAGAASLMHGAVMNGLAVSGVADRAGEDAGTDNAAAATG